MEKNTQEKSLLKINENSIFYKIKNFFKNLFNKNSSSFDDFSSSESERNVNESRKNSFISEIRNIENEETKLLKLQKQYRSGQVKEEELSEEQVNALCKLYDSQIAKLRKSNAERKQRLLEYRKKMRNE